MAPAFAYAVREAVTNVLKHSTASFCEITLRFTDEEAELRVRNDGVARHQASDLGSGLTGMGERLAGVGGKVTARPTGDGEFLLRAVVSLPLVGSGEVPGLPRLSALRKGMTTPRDMCGVT